MRGGNHERCNTNHRPFIRRCSMAVGFLSFCPFIYIPSGRGDGEKKKENREKKRENGEKKRERVERKRKENGEGIERWCARLHIE